MKPSVKNMSISVIIVCWVSCLLCNNFIAEKKVKPSSVSRLKEEGGRCMGDIGKLLAQINKTIADIELKNIDTLQLVLENGNEGIFSGTKRNEAHTICQKLSECREIAKQLLQQSNLLAAKYEQLTSE